MPRIVFNGPAGRIEGICSESTDRNAPLALVLHSHPSFGGSMNNRVVHNIHSTLFKEGYTVLSINFRGVGKSMGQYDHGIGEMTDAATALDWLQTNYSSSSGNLIAGFSFGAWIAMQLIMRRPEINNFIAVSPPVNKYDFSFLSPCPIPGLILQGDQDSIVSEEAVLDLAHRLSKQQHIKVDYKMVNGADHFFRNKIEDLNVVISDYLQTKVLQQKFVQSNMDDITETISETSKQKVYL